jgi:hypothetical protein
MHLDWGWPEPRPASGLPPPSTWLEELELIRDLLTEEEYRRLASLWQTAKPSGKDGRS